MKQKRLTVVEAEPCGRLHRQKYVLVSMNPPQGRNEDTSFNYHVINEGYPHAGCVAWASTTRCGINAGTLIGLVRGRESSEKVFILADAYKKLRRFLEPPVVSYSGPPKRVAKRQQLAMAS